MESRIPVPTDNIFKFYALFGLLLFIFATGATLYVTRSTNALIYSNVIETEALRQLEKPTRVELAKLAVLEKQREIAVSDKNFFTWALSGVIFVSFWAMWHGFRKWQHEIQPTIDETAKVQLEIAKLHLKRLQRELGIAEEIAPQTSKSIAEVPTPKPAQTSPD